LARFDVYANPDRAERKHTPYILDLQNGMFDVLETFVAVPLRVRGFVTVTMSRIQPALQVEGRDVFMDAPMMATFPKRGLGRPIDNLRRSQLEIQDALDVLLGDI
jgi:toxin CcdB